jgi:hypothetical protein
MRTNFDGEFFQPHPPLFFVFGSGPSCGGAEGPPEHPIASARDEFLRVLFLLELRDPSRLLVDVQSDEGDTVDRGWPVSGAEPTVIAPADRRSPATYEAVLRFQAPYLIEKLVKNQVVDTADEGEALFAEAKKF